MTLPPSAPILSGSEPPYGPCLRCGIDTTNTSPTGHWVCIGCLIDEYQHDSRHDGQVDERLQWLRIDSDAREILTKERAERHAAEHLAKTPPIVTLADILATDPGPLQYRISQLSIMGSRVLLAAQAKAGKTTMGLHLCECLVTGHPFLHRFDVQPVGGTVLYINLEVGATTIRNWLAHLHIKDLDRLLIWDLVGRGAALDVRQDSVRAELAHRMNDAKVESLVIDPMGVVMDALGVDENKNSEVGPLLAGFDALIAETDSLNDLYAIHHYGHDGERSRGASKLLGWPDALWDYRLQTPDNDDDEWDESTAPRFLSVKGRDVLLPESRVDFDPDTKRLTMALDATNRKVDRKRSRAEKAVIKVLQALDENGNEGPAKGDLESMVGGNAQGVRKSLEEADRRGLVQVVLDGKKHRVYLTNAGREKLAALRSSSNLVQSRPKSPDEEKSSSSLVPSPRDEEDKTTSLPWPENPSSSISSTFEEPKEDPF